MTTDAEGDAVSTRMALDMTLRRRARPERRRLGTEPLPAARERRTTCAFCFQRGDHPTPSHCLRALERM